MHCVVNSIMFLTTCGCFLQTEANVTPSFKPIITCRNQPEFIDISEDRSMTCCSVGACTEVTTLSLLPNHSSVRLKWDVTDSIAHLTGYKLEVWRDAPDDCPYSCITVSFTQDYSNTRWYNTSSFVIDCTVHQPTTRFQLDVTPLVNNNASPDSQQCQDLIVHAIYPDTSTTSTSSVITERAVNQTDEPRSTSVVTVAIVMIAVILSVSIATVAVWFMVQKTTHNIRNTSVQTHSDNNVLTDISSEQPQSSHTTVFSPLTHLPESFRNFIIELNKET